MRQIPHCLCKRIAYLFFYNPPNILNLIWTNGSCHLDETISIQFTHYLSLNHCHYYFSFVARCIVLLHNILHFAWKQFKSKGGGTRIPNFQTNLHGNFWDFVRDFFKFQQIKTKKILTFSAFPFTWSSVERQLPLRARFSICMGLSVLTLHGFNFCRLSI